jgi:methylmalonyl-CoA mutase cobalamin-binding domain/chain
MVSLCSGCIEKKADLVGMSSLAAGHLTLMPAVRKSLWNERES